MCCTSNSTHDGYEWICFPTGIVEYGYEWVIFPVFIFKGLFGEFVMAIRKSYELEFDGWRRGDGEGVLVGGSFYA